MALLNEILTVCPFNYLLCDVRSRSNLGMDAAGALTRTHSSTSSTQVAICDQSDSFSYLEVPEWMETYQAAPPVTAKSVWSLLPAAVRTLCKPETLVSACYRRLAMGMAHAVHLLMAVNLRIIGMALHSTIFLEAAQHGTSSNARMHSKRQFQHDTGNAQVRHSGEDHLVSDEADMFFGCSDEQWWARHRARSDTSSCESGYSLSEWVEAVRQARLSNTRIFTVMNSFSGERRKEDTQEWLEIFCEFHGILLLMISADLGTDHRWDIANINTFDTLMGIVGVLIDIVLGGPPCSSVSAARFNRRLPGPRPLRFRWCFWGRSDLRGHEKVVVAESNKIYIHFLAICEKTSLAGGAHLWEHPEDRGVDPYPSLWATEEMLGMEARTGSTRGIFKQCSLGAPVPKGTCLTSTFIDIQDFNHSKFQCPGISSEHRHTGRSQGLNEQGHFHTRRLQTYPPALCRKIAHHACLTLAVMKQKGTGPTGFMRPSAAREVASLPCYSTSPSPACPFAVRILNEEVVAGKHVLLTKNTGALYLHVDDTVVFTSADALVPAARLMQMIADQMEVEGFLVPDRKSGNELDKVVGYKPDQKASKFSLPDHKWTLLHDSLLTISRYNSIDVELLRAILGIWLFGAQLRRELMAIPFHIFHFIETHENTCAKLWSSVRLELIAMAHCLPLMTLNIAWDIPKVLFASDAEGASLHGEGGYGVVATLVSDFEHSALLSSSEHVGHGIARAGDMFTGLKHTDRAIKPTIPFTKLPHSLFEQARWTPVNAGRWAYREHITLGESRAIRKVSEAISLTPCLSRSVIYSLCDNMPCTGSHNKGRCSVYGFNRTIRRKAALALSCFFRLILPWVETKVMPADGLSRNY